MILENSKKILILSYFFPPCNKVGGRRWAKFAKYLKKEGYEVFIVCVDVPFKGHCPWENDIASYRKNIFRLPYKETRPFYQINKSPTSFIGKIHYRLSLYNWKLKAIKNKGNQQDISLGYRKELLQKAEQMILENNIKNVVVTGGPFNWCYDSLELKKKYTNLNFITDLRDFWTGGNADEQLNETNRLIESEKERDCIQQSNVVFTPAERIAEYLKATYKTYSNKIHVLPHAFDEDEININTEYKFVNEKKITFAYGGILYGNMDASILKLIELLKYLIEAGYQVALDIYTFDNSYQELFNEANLKDIVTYHKPISPSQLFTILSEKDYVLQLRAGEAQEQHFKSTKFYELISLKRPILYFGPEGDVSHFIVENKLGYSGNTTTTELAQEIIQNKIDPKIPQKFDVSQFGFRSVTQELMKYLVE